MIDDLQPADEEAGAHSDELRAAYLLGRNLHMIEGWLNAVHDIAQIEERPWSWEYPDTLFGDSFDIWPEELFSEVDEALRTLALARVVDAAALVELRHLLELMAQDCISTAECAKHNDREGIRDIFWSVRSNIWVAIQFGKQVLVDGPKTIASLQQLGDRIGELLDHLANVGDHESYLDWLDAMIALARELLPRESVMRIARVRDLVPSAGAPAFLSEILHINEQLLYSLNELDHQILLKLPHGEAIESYLILDDRRGMLTFLGVEIPFDDFAEANALGGLELLRVLIQRPGRTLNTSELMEKSELHAQPAQVAPYLARFRSVLLKKTEERWPQAVKNGQEYKKAKQGFIVPDKSARRSAAGKETWYRLDLPAYRVRYIRSD